MNRCTSIAFAFFVLVAGLSLALSGCRNTRGYDDENIYIGELESLTGSEATFGVTSHRGVAMAVDEVNSTGGLHGRQIKVFTLDTQSNKDRAIAGAKELVNDKNVLALIGEVASERTKLAAPVAQRNRVPMISPASTNPAVTDVGDFIFRACYIDPFQGFVMAKFAREFIKIKRVAVFTDYRSSYSAGLTEYFIDKFAQLGGEVVAEESYSSGDKDFSDALKKIKKLAPEAIFIPGYYAQVAEIARQARKLGIKSQLLGGDGWDSPELFKRGGKAIRGGYYTNHFSPEAKNPEAQPFIAKYKQIYGELPDGTAAVGYDATRMLLSAIRATPDLDTKKIRDALARTKNYAGVTGSITLNENRDAIKSVVILRVDGDHSSYVTMINP